MAVIYDKTLGSKFNKTYNKIAVVMRLINKSRIRYYKM